MTRPSIQLAEKSLEAAPVGESPPISDVPPEQVLAELDKVLASEPFRRAKRLKSFLRFLVARAITRNDDDLREYAIGREVFGRPKEFDPRTDPLVRVEASRLRARLRRYYETEGLGDPVMIGIGKRGYRVLFKRSHDSDSLRVQPASSPIPPFQGDAWPSSPGPRAVGTAAQADMAFPSVLVLPFIDLSPNGDQGYFCDSITVEVISRLARVGGLHVVARSAAFQFRGAAQDIRQIRETLKVSLIVEGSVRKERGRWRVTRQLIDASTGYLVWSDAFERPRANLLELQSQVATATVRLLKFQLRESERRPVPPPGLAGAPPVEGHLH